MNQEIKKTSWKTKLVKLILILIALSGFVFAFTDIMEVVYENFIYVYVSMLISPVLLIPFLIQDKFTFYTKIVFFFSILFLSLNNYYIFKMFDKNKYMEKIQQTINIKLKTKITNLKIDLENRNTEYLAYPSTQTKTNVELLKFKVNKAEEDLKILDICITDMEKEGYSLEESDKYIKCYKLHKKYNDYIKEERFYVEITNLKIKILKVKKSLTKLITGE